VSKSLHLILIGDVSRPEFHEACAALDEVAQVTRSTDVEAATSSLAGAQFAPHGIVLVQAYPGQYSTAAIDHLRGTAPLTRLIVLVGNWCEGEARSGRPLPGVVRINWHEAAAAFRRELPRWFAPDSVWSLPATASDEERLLASVGAPLPAGTGLVAIWTRRPEMAALLADACRSAGYATAWLHPRLPCQVNGVAAAIFDSDALDAATLVELKKFAARVAPAQVVVLLGSPRTQDVRVARTLGTTVMGKPFRVDELLGHLLR